jgi:hypothetical protein
MNSQKIPRTGEEERHKAALLVREAFWSIFDSGDDPPLSRGLASNPLRLSLRSGIAPGANAKEGEKWFSPSLAVDAAAVMRTSASRHVKLRQAGSMVRGSPSLPMCSFT